MIQKENNSIMQNLVFRALCNDYQAFERYYNFIWENRGYNLEVIRIYYYERDIDVSSAEKLYNVISSLPKIFQKIITERTYSRHNIDFMLFFAVCIKQNRKGIEKYGRTIDDCPNDAYNWDLMATEEMVDYLVYNYKARQCKK